MVIGTVKVLSDVGNFLAAFSLFVPLGVLLDQSILSKMIECPTAPTNASFIIFKK
jgi:hypothetical protein